MSHRQQLRLQFSWIKEVISNPCLVCIIRQRWYFEEDETRHALLWKRNVREAFILVAWYRKAGVFCWWWRQSTRRGKSDVTNSRIKLLAAYVWPRGSPQLFGVTRRVWFPNDMHKVRKCWSANSIQRLAESLFFSLSPFPAFPRTAIIPSTSSPSIPLLPLSRVPFRSSCFPPSAVKYSAPTVRPRL